jgi:hydrogenase expression/formation protein HypE
MGEVETGRLVRKAVAEGDIIVLTQEAAIEGTAILATERRDDLEARVAPAALDRAAAMLDHPGISVVRAALAAAGTGAAHAMHDPTEGGIASGLLELAGTAGLGIEVEGDRIPIREETASICAALGVDPLALIASGSLLVAVAPGSAPLVLEALAREGIPAATIATVTRPEHGAFITRGGVRSPLVLPARDEIARVLETGS